jgi:hypothetical protein
VPSLNPDRFTARYGPEWLAAACWYRDSAAAALDDPDWVLRHLDHPAVPQKIEAEFAADTRRRAVMFEALSYGDPSFLLTTPGPSLPGVLLQALGTPRQRDEFQRFVTGTRCRTFFAVTEPGRGSDAAHLETTLHDGRLDGEKLLFGHGASAPIGTVLARAEAGPLGMVAILLTPDLLACDAVRRRVLDMFAMPGTQLAHMRLDGLRVPAEAVLGSHLKAAERMMGMVTTFHRFRPGVAAMALGHGQAVVDYVRDQVDPGYTELDRFDAMLAQARAAAARRAGIAGQAAGHRGGRGDRGRAQPEPAGTGTDRSPLAGPVADRRVRVRVHGGHHTHPAGKRARRLPAPGGAGMTAVAELRRRLDRAP